ncbi:MAG: hypothetical protein AAFY38_16390 [Pseudomonadota bacterium]
MWIRASLIALLASPVLAEGGAPLSAIDWLSQNTPTAAAPIDVAPDEPAIAQSAAAPQVTVAPLEGPAPRRVGLVPGSVTGLPDTLWSNTDGARTAARLNALPVPRLPAAQALLYTVLLSEAAPPPSGDEALVTARIDALMRMGALEPALALIRQAGPETRPELFSRFFDATLLTGDEAQACALLGGPQAPDATYAARVFCAARNGDWDTAALLMGTASALGDVPEAEAALLARFLDPDLFEGEPPLPLPARPDPLAARMMEAIGTPVPTSLWPRVYANLDLRDLAGWKAQLEAAERLAETGAIDANRLLGIVTARRPAASGGIWDRTRALQRLDTALRTGSAEAVQKTLPAALTAARRARMAVPVAELFAQRVLEVSPADTAPAFELVLLSALYEQAAGAFPRSAEAAPLAVAVARGAAAGLPEEASPTAEAVRRAFAPEAPSPDPSLIEMAQGGALGPALLETLLLLDQGVRGDTRGLTRALVTLRALGLEDTARRAALQVLLLEAGT